MDARCSRCGAPLKTVMVRVPVYEEKPLYEGLEQHNFRTLAGYEEREEVAECPRCTGAY